MTVSGPYEEPIRARWLRPRVVLVAAAVLLGAVVAVILTVRGGGADRPAGTGTGGVPAAATPSGGRPEAGSAEDVVPTVAPGGVRWELYRTVALPFSDEAGPREVRGDVAAGYARTPTGALLASQQVAVRRVLAEDWRAVTDRSVAEGPGRDAWVAARARYGRLDPPAPGELGQMAGFRFVDYSPDRAVIQFVSRFGSGRLQVVTSTVAWKDGDWRLVLQPDGGESPTAQTVGSLAGFVAWGGV